VGGLIGEIADTSLSWCHSTASVSSSGGYTGGLIGTAASFGSGGFVDDCFATGAASENGAAAVGGLVGSNGLSITNSFATGSVSGGDGSKVGGLIGDGGSAVNCYATGIVNGGANSTVGGLLGNGGYGAQDSYSTGEVSSGQGSTVGGLVGYDNTIGGTFERSYWDLDTSGVSDPTRGAGNMPNAPGIKGLTDAQLKSGLPKGFNPKKWGQSSNINDGYPYILSNPPQ
jgi:hypothetical protein